jgi:hypothetical protein
MKTMTCIAILVAITLSVIAISGTFFGGQGGGVPTWLNYQGRLTTPSGAAISDESYDAEFRIYSSATGGSLLWSEAQQVATKAGVYSTALGKTTPFPSGPFAQPLWLETEIDGRTLSPRQELGAVAFAMTAQSALTVPAGSINSTNIANASVTHEKLAPDAIPIYSARLDTPFSWTASNTKVTLPNQALQFNVSRPSRLDISYTALVQRSATYGALYTYMYVDGIEVDKDRGYRNGSPSPDTFATSAHNVVLDVDPGMHEVVMKGWATDPNLGGTGQVWRGTLRVMVLPR